ncbi:MAG: S-layer protein [uncultured bacterium (gcode 4)]|uniref:S-layer protein n=1 Tax=uncultured bacterium (gcode 4) TaxID=1234023 RepID=K2FYX0_9BACT|nr:MAG: S-layer protein [uncultured bacterium (gcode 4)]
MKKLIISLALAFLPMGTYASEINWTLDANSINNWIQMILPCNPSSISNGQVNANSCEITCNPNYIKSWNSCVLSTWPTGGWWWGGGWGWGWGWWGGWGSIWSSTDNCPGWDKSSSYYDGLCAVGVPVVSNGNELISTITWVQEIIGSFRVSTKIEWNEKVAQLTSDTWILTLRSSKNSLIKVVIPSWVTVRSDIDWDGTINPPVVVKSASADKLWAAVILAGGNNHYLKFNKEITISVPSSLKDWRDVFIYYSNHSDLTELQKHWVFKVMNWSLNIPINHLSHIILKKKAQNLVGDMKFRDTQESFAKEDIDNLAYLWVVKWYDGWIFRPNSTATRAEYLAMTMKTMEVSVENWATVTAFTDIPKDWKWMIKYIEKAKELWIVNGQVIGWKLKFRPNDPISRAEAISILLNVSKISVDKTATSTDFKDIHNDWMKPYVTVAKSLWIVSWQLIDWQLKFRPNDPITRAESARVINKVLIDYPLPPNISI